VLVATVPTASFLLASSGIYVAVTGPGAATSALWFSAVLRRHGLRLRLAPG
jgi:hypothetical protein